MKKNFTLVMATLLLGNMFAHAQMQDVTKDYISCPDFESCPATEADGSGVVPVVAHWNTLAGTDYSDQGWLLLEQQKNGNGAVIEYGYKVKYGNYSTATEPCTKREGSEGNKALCFTGNAGVCYVSSQEVTLPAGSYRLTVYVYGAYLSTSNPPALANLRNTTGFVSRDGDEYLSTKEKFAINTWEADVIDIQLTEPTTGFFRINYGNSYYILVDDIMLEYENKIITTDLSARLSARQRLTFRTPWHRVTSPSNARLSTRRWPQHSPQLPPWWTSPKSIWKILLSRPVR